MLKNNEQEYEWAIVGGGVVGIFIAEILTREGHSVVLIEKNEKVAAETTRDFHEWIHMGSLYTLIPDNLKTLKYLLGAIDDIFEYYSSFRGMNLVPTESGVEIKSAKKQWFNTNYIHFKFRIGGRKIVFPWVFGIARAIFLIDRIKEHDWLRRRAGIFNPYKLQILDVFKIFINLLRFKGKFYDYETPDFTTNSRNLLNDILSHALSNGLTISTGNEYFQHRNFGSTIIVEGKSQSFKARNLVFANGENLSKSINAKVKVSYAPMAVVTGVPPETSSFVELDYYPKNCINIITKDKGAALIGGISFSNLHECEPYIEEVIRKHREYNPHIQVLHKYNGKKSEILLQEKDNRNYLFHILEADKNVWAIIPGKFTLAFSIAPEFYRRIYKRNPNKFTNVNSAQTDDEDHLEIMSNAAWEDVVSLY